MSLVTVLRQVDILDSLTDTQLELLASICEEKSYEVGEIVLEAFTANDYLWVVAEGQVQIYIAAPPSISTDPDSRLIATLLRGQTFGEISVLDEGLSSTRVICSQPDTQLVRIPRDQLMLLCDTYPPFGYRLMNNLAAELAYKLRMTNAHLGGVLLDAADLSGARLWGVQLQFALLRNTNLHKADLTGANLNEADLTGANLEDAILNETTFFKAVLPDGTVWQETVDMARFTDPQHPAFWRSESPHSPAYRSPYP